MYRENIENGSATIVGKNINSLYKQLYLLQKCTPPKPAHRGFQPSLSSPAAATVANKIKTNENNIGNISCTTLATVVKVGTKTPK